MSYGDNPEPGLSLDAALARGLTAGVRFAFTATHPFADRISANAVFLDTLAPLAGILLRDKDTVRAG